MRNPKETPLTSVADALRIILDHAVRLGEERVLLTEAQGRILAEPLCADRPFPPFDRVTMDGIAIRFPDFAEGIKTFQIAGVQAAGRPPMPLEQPGQCLEIMTGAVLPAGADTVIRYEDLLIENETAALKTDQIVQGQNIHTKGSDRKTGDVIVPPGTALSPGEIGIAATVGKPELLVKCLPRVTIISTGDELVDVHETPLDHQIRSSNIYALSAALQQMGLQPERKHFIDDPAVIRQGLAECLESSDAIILSGGVSEGEFDYVPGALEALGVDKLFHKVRQRPGKPFWFGMYRQQCAVFAMPGNPVSAFMGTQKYFRAWLRASLGLPQPPPVYAILAEDFTFKPELVYFLQVKLEYATSGQLMAHPRMGGGSGDLANLSDADAFLELPAEKTFFQQGETYPVLGYRSAI